ncbi:MAG: nucleoside triphosphate pyrophosphohydrolase [Bacteroidales bacterium]|nr:nucleoside triphosphate pyrophosphohydrolase [Bacteroidales bacterium]
MNNKACAEEFVKLLDIMDQLREKCPWDKKQTNETLRNLTIEETYELADGILSDNNDEIKGELGDLLMHLTFYAKIGEEKGAFNMIDVIKAICEKLIYRHPHVFGEVKVQNAEEVSKNWESLKTREKSEYKRVLSGVPKSLPAVVKAYRIQEKASGVGFDWEEPNLVWDKIEEEFGELKNELDKNNKEKAEAEFGDLLFTMINAARLYKIDPEAALEKSNRKFISRFNYIESETMMKKRSLKDMSLAEMDKLWDEAKAKEKGE